MFKFRASEKFEDIEPHEIILDSLAKRKEDEIGITGNKLEVPILRTIIKLFSFACILVLLILFGKTFQLQVLQGKELSEMANENKFIITKVQAERGVVYDRNMEQLVYNRSSFDLVFYKNYAPEDENEFNALLEEVSLITGKTVEEMKSEIEESAGNEIVLAESLDHQSLIVAETKIRELDGFEIKNNSIREYPEGSIFSHVLGYTGRITQGEYESAKEYYSINDYLGRSGVEKYYENELRKDPGELVIERDAIGNVLSQSVASEPESGNSLVLSLDAGLQRKMVSAMQTVLDRIGSKKAVGVAMDPRTGEVLALASFPVFDNNLFQKGADASALQSLLNDNQLQPLLNRAIQGRYLTGSTIKPFLALAALEEGIITASKKIYCDGEIYVQNPYDPTKGQSFTDMHVHGWTDLKKAIAESCNVYFYTLGGGFGDQEGLGPTRIKEYLELYGWNQKTGIDLPGEVAGFLPDKDWKKKTWKQDWWDGDTYNFSIGQGFLQITPIEVVNAYAAIANGGTLYEPHIVKAVLGSDGKEVMQEIAPEIIKKDFISQESLKVVREGMRQTVTGQNSPQATGLELNALPVSAAAKSGTAETSKDGYYHSWASVFAPYESPEIVMTIMIEDVKGMQRTVVPLAYEILNWYFSQEN